MKMSALPWPGRCRFRHCLPAGRCRRRHAANRSPCRRRGSRGHPRHRGGRFRPRPRGGRLPCAQVQELVIIRHSCPTRDEPEGRGQLQLVRGNGIDELVRNHEALSRFRTTVADLGRIHHETGSYAGRIGLLRHIDNPAEAGRLASLVEAGGQRARAAIEVLGKSRALRATRRLGDAVVSAIKLIAATVLQMGLADLVLLNRGLRSAILTHVGRDS